MLCCVEGFWPTVYTELPVNSGYPIYGSIYELFGSIVAWTHSPHVAEHVCGPAGDAACRGHAEETAAGVEGSYIVHSHIRLRPNR